MPLDQLRPVTALGLYSDSSAVYVDAAVLETDGLDILTPPVMITRSYPADLREQVLALKGADSLVDTARLSQVEEDLMTFQISVAQELLDQMQKTHPNIEIVGYSGHSVRHKAADRFDFTLGKGHVVAQALHLPVVNRFVQADLRAGGTGGPMTAPFLEALSRPLQKPLGYVTLGGISGLTYIGSVGELQAFDIGVGCLLLDKWLKRHADLDMDFDGTWGAKGQPDTKVLEQLLKAPYLAQRPPKTLDRDDFDGLLEQVEGLSTADGATTLTHFIVESIVKALDFLPTRPAQWILLGGGIHNPNLVRLLKKRLGGLVQTASEAKLSFYEAGAPAYAFLAVRSWMNLPISFPGTTGVSAPVSGGDWHMP